jgi:predicted DNA-binding transcriptional regulator AlpA
MASLTYSIPEFCAGYGISRSLLYNLIRERRGPRLMKVGQRTLISHEAAEEWRRRMEAASSMGRAA